MKLEQAFEVKAPIDQVWSTLIDLERVAPCLPGAAITERDENGVYHGTFQVKLGPTTASYRGQISIEDANEATHTATLKAHGTDKRGQGGANATIVNTLVEIEDGTRVEAVTDFTITGRLARFGRGGMIEDISNRLMREFAQCLQAGLTGNGGAAATETAPVTEPTAEEAAASAAAEPRPEDSAAEGKSPAEVGLQGDSPSAPPPSAPPPPAAEKPAPAQFTPPAPAKPIHGFRLFFSVLWERIARLFGRCKQ
jgi:carbon monoxide dehydrogenase subunit G